MIGELSLVCEKCSSELVEQQKNKKNLCTSCLKNRIDLQLGLLSVGLAIIFFVIGVPLLIVGIIYAFVIGFDPIQHSSIYTIITFNYVTPAILLTFVGMFSAFGIRKLLHKQTRIINLKFSLLLFSICVLSLSVIIYLRFNFHLYTITELSPFITWCVLSFVTGIIAYFIDKRNMFLY